MKLNDFVHLPESTVQFIAQMYLMGDRKDPETKNILRLMVFNNSTSALGRA